MDANGELLENIFYANLNSHCGGVKHSGDNRDGVGEGDDETISIDLPKFFIILILYGQ